jgi:hypothetical protein
LNSGRAPSVKLDSSRRSPTVASARRWAKSCVVAIASTFSNDVGSLIA